jgi:hypothetical protein
LSLVVIFLLFFLVFFVFFEQDATFLACEWAVHSFGTERSVAELADARTVIVAIRRVVSCRFRHNLPPRAVLFLVGSCPHVGTNVGGSVSAEDNPRSVGFLVLICRHFLFVTFF